jgi:transcriptional regulator with XRE-family HTH domain
LFADKLKNLRKEKGLTQKELAAIINVSTSAVSQYERGKAIPRRENLILLAEYFGVTVAYLEGTTSIEDIENMLNSVIGKGLSVHDYIGRVFKLSPQNLDYYLKTLFILEKAQGINEE